MNDKLGKSVDELKEEYYKIKKEARKESRIWSEHGGKVIDEPTPRMTVTEFFVAMFAIALLLGSLLAALFGIANMVERS